MKRKILYSIILLLLFGQLPKSKCQGYSDDSKYLFVTPDHRHDCSTCNDISQRFRLELYDTEFFKRMLYSRNLGSTDFGTYYALDIFYVLGSQIRRIQGTSYYGITFSVDSLFKDESGDYHLSRIDWNNNIYLIDREYSLNNTIEEIVKLIVGDLDHFENNNQFKIRVKVDEFTEPVEHINSRQFTRWLTQILNNHELIKQQYVFYYEDEFYPVEQDNKFYGTFRDARPPDDNMLKVDISIFIDNDDKPCDLVVIHSENYRRDDDYKDKIIEAVLEKLVIK